LKEAAPNIVCLQELKAPDEKFPETAIRAAGYGAIWHGQKSWNGVAILARGAEPMEIRRGLPGERFEAYLPPDLAEWLLDLIERGVFADPSAAVFVMLGEHRDLEPHDDLRHELLQRTVQAAIDDPRASLSGIEVKAQSRELADTPLPEAAIWRKIP